MALLPKVAETASSTYYYRPADGRLDYKLDAKQQKVQPVYEDDITPGFASKRVREIRKFPNGSVEDVCQRVEMYYDSAIPADGDSGVTSNSYV